MKEGRARKVFRDIFSENYSSEEKLNAIELVCALPSLVGISKDEMRRAICWLAGYQYNLYIGGNTDGAF